MVVETRMLMFDYPQIRYPHDILWLATRSVFSLSMQRFLISILWLLLIHVSFQPVYFELLVTKCVLYSTIIDIE